MDNGSHPGPAGFVSCFAGIFQAVASVAFCPVPVSQIFLTSEPSLAPHLPWGDSRTTGPDTSPPAGSPGRPQFRAAGEVASGVGAPGATF